MRMHFLCHMQPQLRPHFQHVLIDISATCMATCMHTELAANAHMLCAKLALHAAAIERAHVLGKVQNVHHEQRDVVDAITCALVHALAGVDADVGLCI